MSNQLLTDVKSAELRALLETGEAWQVQQLVQIGFPCIDSYDILKKRVQKRQDDPETWTQLGYKEERKRPSWFRSFERCEACRALLLLDPHEAFSCGHLDCWHKNTSCCPTCGPSVDQLWKFLRHEEPEASNIKWPATPDNLFDETQLRQFATSVVETHRMAFQQVRTEALVSFALNISSTGVTSFLESHRDLVATVKKSRNNILLEWAWERAYRAATDFELLKKALETGLWGKSEQPDVLKVIEGFLYTKLSPIRRMFEAYSFPEFSERIPLLSRRIIRTGTLTTDFTVYNEIKKGKRDLLVKTWQQQLDEISLYYSRCLDSGEWERGLEVVQTWRTELIDDVADICFVYPHLRTAFLELSEDLKLRGELFSYRTVVAGLQAISTKT